MKILMPVLLQNQGHASLLPGCLLSLLSLSWGRMPPEALWEESQKQRNELTLCSEVLPLAYQVRGMDVLFVICRCTDVKS